MKRIFTVLILLFVVLTSANAQQNKEIELYKYKIDKYSRLKKTGIGLSISGGLYLSYRF